MCCSRDLICDTRNSIRDTRGDFGALGLLGGRGVFGVLGLLGGRGVFGVLGLLGYAPATCEVRGLVALGA